MAEHKPNPRRFPRQPKFKIYQCLFNLNSALETIGREIEVLDDYHAVPIKTLWVYRVRAEEMQAGLTHGLLEILGGANSGSGRCAARKSGRDVRSKNNDLGFSS